MKQTNDNAGMAGQKARPSTSTPTQARTLTAFLNRHWQKLTALAFWLLLIGAYAWYASANNLTPLAAAQQLVTFLKTSVWGPVLYIALYAARPLVFFPASLLTIMAGTVFGPLLGVAFVVVASNISASVAWLVGRFFGQGILSNAKAGGVIQKYTDRMRANSFETILIMRFLFLPYDLVNYLAGFLRISWRPFIVATLLGSIPGTIAFVGFGASVQNIDGVPQIDPWVLAGSAAIFVVSLVLSRLLRRREGVQA